MSDVELTTLVPDAVFDGGDLDCGSGLVLLIRQHMLGVAVGGVLEMRSREGTVKDDLPPWCRVVGHDYLGALPGPTGVRYFVRRNAAAVDDAKALAEDKARAEEYEWRLRTRATAHLEATVYCRNFQWKVGQAASFEEKDAHPSALEYLLGALTASLATGLATECARSGVALDDVELTARGRLDHPLALLGLDDGEPVLRQVTLKCFASTFAPEADVRAAWERAVARSPIVATLKRAATLDLKLALV